MGGMLEPRSEITLKACDHLQANFRAHLHNEPDARERTRPRARRRALAGGPMQALIVEDDRHLASALAHILAREGYECDVVHDGEAGVA